MRRSIARDRDVPDSDDLVDMVDDTVRNLKRLSHRTAKEIQSLVAMELEKKDLEVTFLTDDRKIDRVAVLVHLLSVWRTGLAVMMFSRLLWIYYFELRRWATPFPKYSSPTIEKISSWKSIGLWAAAATALEVLTKSLVAVFLAINFQSVMNSIGVSISLASNMENLTTSGALVACLVSFSLGYRGRLGPFGGVREYFFILGIIAFVVISRLPEKLDKKEQRKDLQNTLHYTKLALKTVIPVLVMVFFSERLPSVKAEAIIKWFHAVVGRFVGL